MEYEEGRSARKRRAIMETATTVFLDKGYVGTSMDEIAALAGVSKQTVYKHFVDKDRLFTEIVMATLDQVDDMIHLVADLPEPGDDLGRFLTGLAQQFATALMQPRLLRLRRLILANADRFPKLGRTWYEQGFERVLATLAGTFQRLADEGRLELDDPLRAAHHFSGLLLWIPLNEAMFSGGGETRSSAELREYSESAVRVFLAAYRPAVVQASG